MIQTIIVIVIIGLCILYLAKTAFKSFDKLKGKGGCNSCGKE